MLTKTKIVAILATLLLICAAPVTPAFAEGDAKQGASLAYTCLGCHGIEGYRNAYPSYRVPKLGGQKASYIVLAVQGYRDGQRAHPTMTAQAESLSDQEIADIAAYISSMANSTVDSGGSQNVGFEKAATCVACHGPNGISVNPLWPTIAGQHEEYLVAALNQYRDGTRKDVTMSQMAAVLTDEDVEILARYYAGLEGLETTVPLDTE